MLEIDLTELDGHIARLERFQQSIPEMHKKYLEQEAEEFLRLVIPRTPVETGAMLDGWRIDDVQQEEGETSLDIGNEQAHSQFVEFGTAGRAAQYPMTKTANEILHKRPGAYGKFMKDEWDLCKKM